MPDLPRSTELCDLPPEDQLELLNSAEHFIAISKKYGPELLAKALLAVLAESLPVGDILNQPIETRALLLGEAAEQATDLLTDFLLPDLR